MKIKSWHLLLICVMILLGSCEEQTESDEPTAPDPAELAFKILCDGISRPDLPYEINEQDLRYLKHSNYIPMDADMVSKYIGRPENETDYYLVAKPVVFDTVVALIILESSLDTLFNASEKFYLRTFSGKGLMIDELLFAASVVSESHTKTLGTLFPDLNITTQTFEYSFENGAWVKPESPTQARYYHIDSSGSLALLHADTVQNGTP